jgi:C-terminal processing protease CtpA/Prc
MTGGGLIGMAMAEGAVSDCSADMRAAGYLEIERAGVIGIVCAETRGDERVHVLKVAEESPAYFAGVESGDLVLEVQSQPVFTQQEALVLLFGEAGTDVSVRFQRGEFDTVITFTRVPRSVVYGQSAPAVRY